MAPPGRAYSGRPRTRLREPRRLRPILLPQRKGPRREGIRTVLIAPKEEKPRGAPPVERRLRLRGGYGGRPARNDQRDRADRDVPGRIRDGGDPLRVTGPRRGPQRGPMGLSLQHHQDAASPEGLRAAGPSPAHDDRPVHARVHGTPGEDVPPPRRSRDRRHGRVRPEPQGPESERGRLRQGAGKVANLREATAPAELARSLVWQWVHHGARLEDERTVNEGLVRQIGDEELDRLRMEARPSAQTRGRFREARKLFDEIALKEPLVDFLTIQAYELLE